MDFRSLHRSEELHSRHLRPSANTIGARGALWLIAPLALLGVLIGVEVVQRDPIELFSVAFGVLLAIGAGWILMSVFAASGPHICPSCEEPTLLSDEFSVTFCKTCGWYAGLEPSNDDEREFEGDRRRLGGEHRRW